VKNKFTVDDYRHYIFTPRDLTSWCQGLLRYHMNQENLLDVLAYEVSDD
jgi:dynein heavy chain 2, cytosolic